MSIDVLPLCATLGAVLVAAAVAAVEAEPSSGAGHAASQPASAATKGATATKGVVEVQVRFGAKRPGKPAPARLEIAALDLKIDTDDSGARKISAVPKGKVSLKVFVAGADKCTVEFDAESENTTVKVFVPKRGLGPCERIAD